MTYKRDTTIDFTGFEFGTYNGLLQVDGGAYDICGDTLKEMVEAGKELASILGVTVDVFNLEAPEA